MQNVEDLAARLDVPAQELTEQLAAIGLITTRALAQQLADADAVEHKGFEAILQDPAVEPQHWREALARLTRSAS